MITITLARLRQRLFEVEDRLAIARIARSPSAAVVATLHADALEIREQIAAAKRQRLERVTP